MSNNQPNPTPKPSTHGQHLDAATWEALKAAGFSEQELHDDQPFGPVIFAYTRKQAIADGVLVDMTRPGFGRISQLAGLRVHCAMTATCFAAVITRELNEKTAWEALCRWGNVLEIFRTLAARRPTGNTVHFVADGVDGVQVPMYVHIGPGDAGEPVLTFMLEGED